MAAASSFSGSSTQTGKSRPWTHTPSTVMARACANSPPKRSANSLPQPAIPPKTSASWSIPPRAISIRSITTPAKSFNSPRPPISKSIPVSPTTASASPSPAAATCTSCRSIAANSSNSPIFVPPPPLPPVPPPAAADVEAAVDAAPRAATVDTASEPRGTDSQEYLKKEQKELLQVVRDRVELREEQRKRALEAAARKPFTLQARQTTGGLQLTPDEKYVIATVFEAAATPAKSTIVPNYITDSVYTEDIPGPLQCRRYPGHLAPRHPQRRNRRSEVGGSRPEEGARSRSGHHRNHAAPARIHGTRHPNDRARMERRRNQSR